MRAYSKIIVAVVVLGACFLSLQAESPADKIRIIVPQANVYLKPSAESLVIAQVRAGNILAGERYDENWFKTSLPADKDGIVTTGFIKAADAEIFSEEKAVVKEETPPVTEKRAVDTAQPIPPAPLALSDQTIATSAKGIFLDLHASFASFSKIADATFSRVPTYSYMNTIRDNGTLSPGMKSSGFGGEFVFGYFLSDKFGIVLSASYLPGRDVDLHSS
jgi:hypothetical protein